MIAHRERHIIESTFSCGVCPKKFTSHSSLWKHIKSHTGERPFVCEICHKGFTQLANLQRHHFVHNGKFNIGIYNYLLLLQNIKFLF